MAQLDLVILSEAKDLGEGWGDVLAYQALAEPPPRSFAPLRMTKRRLNR
jgi:hypothetical protein